MSVGEGPNYVCSKTGFLRKKAVLELAVLLIFGGRVSQMFFEFLFLLWICNQLIVITQTGELDSEIPLARGETVFI